MTYTAEQRDEVVAKVVEGLEAGIPLAVLCGVEGMPCPNSIRDWAKDEPELSERIARARELGWDAIAARARMTARGLGDSTADVQRDKLIIDTDMKLLAKWDPRRYGDTTTLKHADANGETIKPDEMTVVTRLAAICLAITQQQPADAPD